MSETERLQKLIKAVGLDGILKYRAQTIPEFLLDDDNFAAEKADQWISLPAFQPWAMHYIQSQALAGPGPIASINSQLPLLKPVASGSQSFAQQQSSETSPLQPHPLDSDIEVVSTTVTPKIKTEQPPHDKAQTQSRTNSKKRQVASENEVIELSDADRPKKKKLKKTRHGKVQITREFYIDRLETIHEFPESWTSCREDESFGFLLDMRGDTREWPLGSDGKKLSMDTDSWGKGSGGSTELKDCPIVFALDEQRCQVARHSCSGSYICEQFDMELLDSVERYEPDWEQRKRFFEAERAQNELEATSPAVHAALFYQEMLSTACSLAGCTGVAVLRPMKQKNFDGKMNFIGCSGWVSGSPDTKRHRFKSIPSNIDEVLLKELFQNSGAYSQATVDRYLLKSQVAACKYIVSSVTGAKGKKKCPYSHIDAGNRAVSAQLKTRPCKAKIAIYSPLNRDDYRAIVIITGAHNHPMFPVRKLSSGSKGAKAYKDAAARIGAVGLTVTKLDAALANQNIDVSDLDPALINPRLRRNLLKDVKIEQNGGLETDIKGIHALIEKGAGLPLDERYIHQFLNELDEDGSRTELIITMVPRLAEQFHCVTTTLHDNTYKRIADKKWKEWEVVAWSNRLNMRETLARVFMSRETRKSFYLAFSGLWKTVKTLTGREVQFKFMHGTGLKSILVDGSKPQVNGCGDALWEIFEKLPNEHKDNLNQMGINKENIVEFIVRLCLVHIDRDFDALAPHITKEDNAYIRRIRSLETKEELDEFWKWCGGHSNKKIQDWAIDKRKAPWFVPCINVNFTKMQRDSWFGGAKDTNMNESAHPHMNAFGGTLLSFIDGILIGRVYDFKHASRRQQVEEHHILPYHQNTVGQRQHRNILRKDAVVRKVTGQIEVMRESGHIDNEILALRARKASLKVPKGKAKRLATGKALRGKSVMSDPAYEDLSDMENDAPDSEPPQPASPPPILHQFGFEPLEETAVNLVQVDNAQLAPVWSDWSEYSQEELASLAMLAMNRFEAQYGAADNVELAPLWANNSGAEQARLEREAIDTLEAQYRVW
ncbi:hypothetical protein C8J56DRAFT_1085151 [Mycena floridula]|nr:hypothetical protein C8J56DRAFT_1085151 [Mycena floridula]